MSRQITCVEYTDWDKEILYENWEIKNKPVEKQITEKISDDLFNVLYNWDMKDVYLFIDEMLQSEDK